MSLVLVAFFRQRGVAAIGSRHLAAAEVLEVQLGLGVKARIFFIEMILEQGEQLVAFHFEAVFPFLWDKRIGEGTANSVSGARVAVTALR